ncbi:hypothetical protein ACFC4G_45265 [Streptomyces sp. NPDC056002]|uniref:hypothetical protein n=1 Tax=Streptomyces sp. NPDC056002 TaxID=3345675 RepID=UPI0035D9A410
MIEAAAQAAGAPVEVLEAVNMITPSGLLMPDLIVVDAGATKDDLVNIDAEAVLLAVELVSPGNTPIDRKLKPSPTRTPTSRTSGESSSTPACASSWERSAAAATSSKPPPSRARSPK